MPNHCWLSDRQFVRLQPLLPPKVRGVPRVDDRRGISGSLHVLQSGCRWRAAPSVYGPHKPLYNRVVRWARKGVWDHVVAELAAAGGPPVALLLDSTPVKVPRSAAGGKGGRLPKPLDARGGAARPNSMPPLMKRAAPAGCSSARAIGGHRGDVPVAPALVAELTPARCLADTAYDSDALRAWLWRRGCQPIIPTNPTRKRHHPFDPVAYQVRQARAELPGHSHPCRHSPLLVMSPDPGRRLTRWKAQQRAQSWN